VTDNSLIVFGGVSTTGYLNNTYILSIKITEEGLPKGVWEELRTSGDIPVPRGYSSLVAKARDVYLFGGVSTNLEFLNDIHRLNLDTMKWTKLKPRDLCTSPDGRCGAGVDLQGDLVIFFGGCGDRYVHFEDIWAFDLSLYIWMQIHATSGHNKPSPRLSSSRGSSGTPPVKKQANGGGAAELSVGPSKRRNPAFVVCGLELVVVGGNGSGTSEERKDIFTFDLVKRRWVARGDLPKSSGLAGALAIVYGPYIIIHGGLRGSAALDSLYLKCLGPSGFGSSNFISLSCKEPVINPTLATHSPEEEPTPKPPNRSPTLNSSLTLNPKSNAESESATSCKRSFSPNRTKHFPSGRGMHGGFVTRVPVAHARLMRGAGNAPDGGNAKSEKTNENLDKIGVVESDNKVRDAKDTAADVHSGNQRFDGSSCDGRSSGSGYEPALVIFGGSDNSQDLADVLFLRLGSAIASVRQAKT